MSCSGLVRLDLSWSELVWVCLCWSELVCVGLSWSEFVWVFFWDWSATLHWSELGLSLSELVWVGLSWSKLVWVCLIWSEFVCVGLCWCELVCVGLSWSEFVWVGLRLVCNSALVWVGSEFAWVGLIWPEMVWVGLIYGKTSCKTFSLNLVAWEMSPDTLAKVCRIFCGTRVSPKYRHFAPQNNRKKSNDIPNMVYLKRVGFGLK